MRTRTRLERLEKKRASRIVTIIDDLRPGEDVDRAMRRVCREAGVPADYSKLYVAFIIRDPPAESR